MECDVAVIGAGPAGSVSAKMLADQGLNVIVIEASRFPRFSIGESLLPQVTECLQIAGMFNAVEQAGFQYKDGAHFVCGTQGETFLFEEKSAAGPFHSYEVKRADFDLILAQEAEKAGARIVYGTRVISWNRLDDAVVLGCRDSNEEFSVNCRFVMDASGFGRVMSKLADMEYPSDQPPRSAIFRHIRHNITCNDFDPNKITIAQGSTDHSFWLWFIPFADQSASIGLVGDTIEAIDGCFETVFAEHICKVDVLDRWLKNSQPLTEIQNITGYSCNVKSLFGDKFVMLGNAAEFVDPIFSSGVAIACRSAITAVPLVVRELKDSVVNWLDEYEKPMRSGVNVFHAFVKAWYEGTLPRLIYSENKDDQYRKYISSILAGYVWDDKNPLVYGNLKRLRTLSRMVAAKDDAA
ncbi:MAG: FAD-dependent oxidoreductase [marine bacterium B5-7]|nr:MAG: FAD-dependent oxidoreductase [marine bacterium B5-7]